MFPIIYYLIILAIFSPVTLVVTIFTLTLLYQIKKEVKQIMATMAELQAQVAETIGMEQSALVYMQGLKAKIQELIDAGADPAAFQALVDELDVSEKAMAAAMVVNP